MKRSTQIYILALGVIIWSSFATYFNGLSLGKQVACIVSFWVFLLFGCFSSATDVPGAKVHSINGLFKDLLYLALLAGFCSVSYVVNYRLWTLYNLSTSFLELIALLATCLFLLVFVRRRGPGFVLLAFCVASYLGTISYYFVVRGNLVMDDQVTERVTADGVQPNLMAFCCAGFLVFKIAALRIVPNWLKLITLFLILLDLVFIFYTGSRGSIFAIIIGLVAITILNVTGVALNTNISSGSGLAKIALLIGILIGCALVVAGNWSRIYDSSIGYNVRARLELDSRQRGLDSGMSGRVDIWHDVWHQFSIQDFVFGIGFRQSQERFGAIDNGYIVLTLEDGLLVALLVCWRFASISFYIVRRILSARDAGERFFWNALFLAVITYLSNNFVARYLFGFGNPYSLFWLFLLMSAGSLRLLGSGLSRFVKIKLKQDLQLSSDRVSKAELLDS